MSEQSRVRAPISQRNSIRTNMMRELIILGGGPAGLGLAFYAHRAGVPFLLFERSAELGGLCRTFRHGEHLYDSGAHRLHDRDPDITKDLKELLSNELLPIDAPSKIFHRGRFIDFPPTPLSVFSGISLTEALHTSIDLLRCRWKRQACVSFADFAVSQFGESLARHTLLDYSEKVWGLPAEQLSPDAATRRLKGMTLLSLLIELTLPRKKVHHIDGGFLYPKRGYGQIIERLRDSLPADLVRTGHEVVGLECSGERIRRIHFSNGRSYAAGERTVSTLPLPLLVKFLGNQLPENAQRASQRLRFRHIRLLFLRLSQPRVSDNASIYIPNPELCMSRLYEPKNRSASMAPKNETSLVVEVPCFLNDPVQRLSSNSLAERVINELDGIGIIRRGRVVEWRHHFLANAYPVYSLDYSDSVKLITDALASIAGLDTIGRSGLFFYSHLHDQLRFAKDYVRSLKGYD